MTAVGKLVQRIIYVTDAVGYPTYLLRERITAVQHRVDHYVVLVDGRWFRLPKECDDVEHDIIMSAIFR